MADEEFQAEVQARIGRAQHDAQQAGERRYAFASEMLDLEPDSDEEAELFARFPGEELAAPFCGCDTCVVREILDAAWEPMFETALALARLEVAGAAGARTEAR